MRASPPIASETGVVGDVWTPSAGIPNETAPNFTMTDSGQTIPSWEQRWIVVNIEAAVGPANFYERITDGVRAWQAAGNRQKDS